MNCFPVLESLYFGYNADDGCNVAILDGHSSLIKMHLHLVPVRPDIYFSKLGRFSNLQELTLVMNGSVPLSNNVSTCSFPHLQKLVIRNACSFTLFSKIEVHSLRFLHIDTAFYPEAPPSLIERLQQCLWNTFPKLLGFLQDAGSNIQEFDIRCWFLQDNDALRHLLERLPSVRRLCLDTWFTDGSDSPAASASDNVEEQAPAGVVDVVYNQALLLPQLRAICLHYTLYKRWATNAVPFARSPPGWRSLLAFLRSRNSIPEASGIGVAGAATEGSEHSSSTGRTSKPNLVVFLPDLEGVKGVDDAQLQALESIRELDGVSIAIESVRSCNVGR
ncbi:hypothetical protein H1R20_g9716, partial [Candolleomyces eurysporus]